MNQDTFAEVKDKIIYVLENAASAEINGRPHEAFLDMIKSFRIYRCEDDYDYNITEYDLEKWGVGLDTVVEAANRNSPVLNPPMIYRVAYTPSGIYQVEMGENINMILENMAHNKDAELPMYMLTNVNDQYGASSIINKQLLEQIAELWKEDIILLPSSLHEFLMIPFSKRRMELKDWQETVSMMNSQEFMEDNVLSDSVYLYDWNKKEVVIGYSSDK